MSREKRFFIDDRGCLKALLYSFVVVIFSFCFMTFYSSFSLNNLEKAIRDHWNIECGLHWRLDVIMIEDHSRNREKNSILNLATVRKIAFNLASLDNSFGKVPLQRKLTRYMLDFKNIEKLIFDVIPNLESCQ